MQNKLNLELKYHCKDFAPIREILKNVGAKKVGKFSQKDYFFNLPQNKKVPQRLKLRIQENQSTLVYYKRGDFSKKSATVAKVSLLEVADKKFLDFLKKVLGTKAIVIKSRELWKKDNTVFNLDTVKNIGKIFEIEVSVAGDVDKAKKEFNKYKEKFQPHLDKIVKGSNLDLILKTHPIV
ncbi:MAG: class IV adenylate cyclase [Candidatus Curtissbacteria bacterium]|nr:class IV adenylate cyclase [Candidatus Curtissbacteria bacterium]